MKNSWYTNKVNNFIYNNNMTYIYKVWSDSMSVYCNSVEYLKKYINNYSSLTNTKILKYNNWFCIQRNIKGENKK